MRNLLPADRRTAIILAAVAIGCVLLSAPAQSQQSDSNHLADSVSLSEQGPSKADASTLAEIDMKKWRIKLGFYSILFTAIPLMLGTAVFLVLVHNSGKDEYEPFFGEGQLVQVLVILLVVGNVCSLAIMDVLGKSEIAAIYGGIVGYVLGRKSAFPPTPKPAKGKKVVDSAPDESASPARA